MNERHKKSLMLNADFSPLAIIGWQKAITLDFKSLVVVVDFYKDDHIICSSGHKWPIPAVVALKKYIHQPIMAFSKKNVFLRDGHQCQYCGQYFPASELTYDHVIPRSKWNGDPNKVTSWNNIVSCCYKCNFDKADKTPEEAGMVLLSQPKKPSVSHFVMGYSLGQHIPEEWRPFMPTFYIEREYAYNK